jgi:hypothetical protein
MISCREHGCFLFLHPEPVMADIKCKLVPVINVDGRVPSLTRRGTSPTSPLAFGLCPEIIAYDINKIRTIRELGLLEAQIE